MKNIQNLYSTPCDLRSWLMSISPVIDSKSNDTRTEKWKPLYFIAMTARSGSTMLCSLIEKLGYCGIPDEYLNPRGPFQENHSKYGGASFKEYLENIYNHVNSNCNMLGIKTAFLDFYPAANYFSEEFNEFSKFIYLTRNNLYAQAVSLWSAEKSKLWHSFDGTRSTISSSQYNYDEISMCLKQLINERVKWEAYFSLYGIIPHRMTYEDLCSNQDSALNSLVEFLGLQIPREKLLNITPSTTALATYIQNDIACKFQKEFINRREENKLIEKFEKLF
jgi:LPS sulfotransferase NodH